MSRTVKRLLGIIGVVVFVGGGGGLAFFEASKRAWIKIDKYDIRTEGSLQVGDLAPDLGLTLGRRRNDEPLRAVAGEAVGSDLR